MDLKSKTVGDALFASDSQQRTGNNHREFGGMVLFADGRAERSPPKAAFVIHFPSNSIPLNPRP